MFIVHKLYLERMCAKVDKIELWNILHEYRGESWLLNEIRAIYD